MAENKIQDASFDELLISNLHSQTKKFKDAPPNKNFIPSIFKKINSKKIMLPKDFEKSASIVEDAIEKRSSWRNFSGYIELKEVSKVLHYAKGFRGLTHSDLGILQKANVPSAGSRHPIELYAVLQRVNGINNGIYHYDNENHALEAISEEMPSKEELLSVFNKNESLVKANIIILMTAIHRRTSWKYGPRAYRFIHLDAGHIGQNLYLISESMGLGACAFGGWKDELADKLIKIDGIREIVVYAVFVGKKAKNNNFPSSE